MYAEADIADKRYFSARLLFEELVKTLVFYSSRPTFANADSLQHQWKSDAVFQVVLGKAAINFAYTSILYF